MLTTVNSHIITILVNPIKRYPMAVSLSYRPLAEVRIDIKDKEEENKKASSPEPLLLSTGREVSVKPITAPQNYPEVLEVVKIAEQASRSGNLKRLEECDMALAEFDLENKRAQKTKNEDLLRVWRLNLPRFKSEITKIINTALGSKTTIVDDQGSQFADMLEGRLTDHMMKQMRARAEGMLRFEDSKLEEEIFCDLAEQLVKNDSRGLKTLNEKSSNERFIFLLFLLNKPEYVKSLPIVFTSLMNSVVEGEAKPELASDFVYVSLRHSELRKCIASGEDKVILTVNDPPNENPIDLVASRLLLSAGSEYFQMLVTKGSLSDCKPTPEASPILDLTSSKFDKEMMEMLMCWLTNPQFVSFSSDSKIDIKKIERFLTSYSALSLTNEAEFREKIELDLAHGLDEDNLKDTLALALRYKLKLAQACCVDFINKMGLKMQQIEDKTFKIIQKKDRDISKKIYEAAELLKNHVKITNICETRLQKTNRCSKILSSITRMGRYSIGLAQKAWNKIGGLATRTGLCYLSIYAIEEASHQTTSTTLLTWQKVLISLSVAITYPTINRLLHRCILNRITRNWDRFYIIAVTDIIPISLQRSFFGSVEKIKNCARLCFHPPLLTSEQPLHPIFNVLSQEMTTIDLSQTYKITDVELERIVNNHLKVEHLTLGSHPFLTSVGFAHLKKLTKLKRLSIKLKEGVSPGTLNLLKLHELFSENNPLRIDLEVSDATISYYPIHFLRNVPPHAEVHVELYHEEISPSYVLFESRYNTARFFKSWPDTITRLTESCPQLTHLDCTNVYGISNQEFISIGRNCPHLREINVVNSYFNNEGFEEFLQNCPNLEKISLQVQNEITDAAIEQLVLRCPQLKEVHLNSCHQITNQALDSLSRIPLLKVCRLQNLFEIDDAGVQKLLNRKPWLEDLQVSKCGNVTDQMLYSISQRPSTLCSTIIERINNKLQRESESPIPMELGRKILPPIFFQLLIDNLCSQTILEEGLGLSKKDAPVKIRTSQLEGLAKMPILELINRKKYIMNTIQNNNESEFSDEIIWQNFQKFCYLVHFFQNEVPNYSTKIETSYKEFLKATFSDAFVKMSEEQAQKFLTELKTEMNLHDNLKYLLPSLNSKSPGRVLIHYRVEYFSEVSAFNAILDRFLKAIKEVGDLNKWSDEQRSAAFLTGILTDISWINEHLFPPVAVNHDEEKKEE